MFLVFLAAENLKNTIPSSPVVGRVERESCFLFFLAAENLKNTIPSTPVVGRVERESFFWCF